VRVLYNRIVNFLDSTDFLDSNQFGFLPRSSMTSAALAAFSRIQIFLDRRCYTAAIFIDVSKAFDCVDHFVLLTKLFQFKIIHDYLFARTQVISSFFTNDAILIYFESNYDELQRHIREDLLKIHDWFYKNLLNFNVSKTKYIIFNPKNKNIPNLTEFFFVTLR
jgi:hypothetical protein